MSGSSGLTGFSQGSNRRVVGVWVVFLLALASWALGGYLGAAIAVVVGVALVFVRWWGQPAWSWAVLWRRGRRPMTWDAPITVANNRSGGGVRVQDGVAVVAVQLLGRAHQATTVTGSVTVETDNVIDIAELVPMLDHALGLQLDSISIVTFGSRHGTVGDFPRVYDSEIGTPPYAGRRETWLIMRLRVIDNAQSLRWRITVGTAVVSVAQRIAGLLRCQGLRAKVATATDLVELDRRLGADAVAGNAQRWKAVRGDAGWMTSYAYPREAISSRVLAQAWTLRADEVIQNVTVYPDATCTATITVRTPTPAPTAPSVVLRRLNGEQAAAAAANMCGPRPHLRGLRRSPLPAELVTEIGPSGVLVGKLSNGDRLMMPVTDAGELSRVFVAGDDTIAKRIVIRIAGAGERVSVHTRDKARWASVRMPEVAIVETARPAPRTTVSVVEYVTRRGGGSDAGDVAIAPTPRPSTIVSVAPAGTKLPEAQRLGFEVTIEQVGRAMVNVTAAGRNWMAEMDMFRAENRYVSLEPVAMSMSDTTSTSQV
ncbi:MAG: type VII secretion protein EccE [Mycobacterium sp.]